ncbi:MAG: hypothetical protein IKS04_04715 [Clostridia bacterium]|jgi:hypothetical protein|nr:hypothetical protein [Clostridia bacterium]
MKITRNFNILPLEYYMTFENGEMSDIFEWEENLTDDEKSAYIETVLLSLPLDESPVLVGVLKRAAKEIIEGGLDDFVCSDSAYKLNVRFAEA